MVGSEMALLSWLPLELMTPPPTISSNDFGFKESGQHLLLRGQVIDGEIPIEEVPKFLSNINSTKLVPNTYSEQISYLTQFQLTI